MTFETNLFFPRVVELPCCFSEKLWLNSLSHSCHLFLICLSSLVGCVMWGPRCSLLFPEAWRAELGGRSTVANTVLLLNSFQEWFPFSCGVPFGLSSLLSVKPWKMTYPGGFSSFAEILWRWVEAFILRGFCLFFIFLKDSYLCQESAAFKNKECCICENSQDFLTYLFFPVCCSG